LPADASRIPGMMTKRHRRGIRQGLSFLIIVLYIVCASLPGVLHAVLHDSRFTVLHTVAQENDPCHRMLYHGEAAACDHDAHLVDSDECSMCDVVCHADQVLVRNVIVPQAVYAHRYFSCYKQHLDSYWAVLSSSRAPPVRA
jgi:hypothetical protein